MKTKRESDVGPYFIIKMNVMYVMVINDESSVKTVGLAVGA